MPRNRMIKPEFWASETLARVSRDARLTFVGIWNFCDDYGFYLHSMRSILGDIYPLDESVDEKKLTTWVNELIAEKLIIPIEYKGKKILFVTSWAEHQMVQHKSKRAFIEDADLESVIRDTLESHEDLMTHYLESHAPKKKVKEKDKGKVKEKVKVKTPYGEGKTVLLTDEEYEKLINGWGDKGKAYKTEDAVEWAIEELDMGIRSKGYTYTNHYAALQGWVYEKYLDLRNYNGGVATPLNDDETALMKQLDAKPVTSINVDQ